MTRVIALSNQKGGVGKTTTAVNLASCLSGLDHEVLLVDLDPQANATSGVGVPKEAGASLYDVLLGEAPLEDRIRSTHLAGLDILPSEVDLAGAEIDVARLDRSIYRLRDAMTPLLASGRYNYVIVDCPPSLGILTMNVLVAAHGMLIPLQCEYYAMEGLSVITHMAEKVRDGGANPQLVLHGIVMTMYDSRTKLSQQVVHEVREHFGDRLYTAMVPRSVRLSEAPSHGMPIVEYDPGSNGAQAYWSVTDEFLEREKAFLAPGE